MKINCPQFFKWIYSLLKLLYLIDFKLSAAYISLKKLPRFYIRANFRLTDPGVS